MKTAIFLTLLLAFAPAASALPNAARHGEQLAREHAQALALQAALRIRLAELRH